MFPLHRFILHIHLAYFIFLAPLLMIEKKRERDLSLYMHTLRFCINVCEFIYASFMVCVYMCVH